MLIFVAVEALLIFHCINCRRRIIRRNKHLAVSFADLGCRIICYCCSDFCAAAFRTMSNAMAAGFKSFAKISIVQYHWVVLYEGVLVIVILGSLQVLSRPCILYTSNMQFNVKSILWLDNFETNLYSQRVVYLFLDYPMYNF